MLLCGGIAVSALELLERPGLQVLGGLFLVAAAVEVVLFLLGIWKGGFDDTSWTKLVPISFAWALATLLTAGTAHVAGRLRPVGTGAIALSSALFAVVATGLVWSETDSDGWLKTLGSLGILTVGGFLLVPLLRRLIFGQHRSEARLHV
ncbi:MAG: hypothetical protein ABR583_12505 [Gaiellaceae bacterium]